MPNKRVTMQDIADACGLSRNTVSKVFNGRGAVPQATKDMVILKAQELGYGLPSVEQKAAPPLLPERASPCSPASSRRIITSPPSFSPRSPIRCVAPALISKYMRSLRKKSGKGGCLPTSIWKKQPG